MAYTRPRNHEGNADDVDKDDWVPVCFFSFSDEDQIPSGSIDAKDNFKAWTIFSIFHEVLWSNLNKHKIMSFAYEMSRHSDYCLCRKVSISFNYIEILYWVSPEWKDNQSHAKENISPSSCK